jgi:integrase
MRSAVRVDFPYLVYDPDQAGNDRYYVRMKGKPKIRIKAKFGTEAFNAEYWEARKMPPKEAALKGRAKTGTLRHLIERYMESGDYKALDANLTQPLRARILSKLIEAAGEKGPLLSPASIRKGVKRRGYGAAKDFLTTLRGLYKWAFEEGLVAADPTSGVHLKRQQTDGFHTWTDQECTTFENRWPLGTQPRTAYAIGRYTAQRPSDAVRMGRPMVRDGKIHLRQWKNRSKQPVDVTIPLLPQLQAALSAWQGKGLTWLETPDGNPYTSDGFRVRFREWCNAAGLYHCSFHGLRKATASKMAEQGRTPHQIMSVLGHSTHQQAATYTKKADREHMAREALAGLFVSEISSQPKPETKKRKKA